MRRGVASEETQRPAKKNSANVQLFTLVCVTAVNNVLEVRKQTDFGECPFISPKHIHTHTHTKLTKPQTAQTEKPHSQ